MPVRLSLIDRYDANIKLLQHECDFLIHLALERESVLQFTVFVIAVMERNMVLPIQVLPPVALIPPHV
jgi:hypothetical protein